METENEGYDYYPEHSEVVKMLSDAKVKLEYAMKCNKDKKALGEEITKITNEINEISSFIKTLKYLIKTIDMYLNQKKLSAETFIKEAVEIAKTIIPSTEDYEVIINDKELNIISKDGQEIEEADGQGFASILAVMILLQVILFTNSRPTLILDEKFAAVRADKTALLANLLDIYKDKVQFIIIEQKPEIEVFANNIYEVIKEGNNSFVKRGVVDSGL